MYYGAFRTFVKLYVKSKKMKCSVFPCQWCDNLAVPLPLGDITRVIVKVQPFLSNLSIKSKLTD